MIQVLSNTSEEFQKHTAILYLPNSTEPGWYSKKIAGVPFLLRNLFALQKFGIRKLIIWVNEPMNNGLNALLEKIKSDQRLTLSWDCQSSHSLFPNDSSFIVLDGSILIDGLKTKNNIVREDINAISFLPEFLKKALDKREIYFLQFTASEQQCKLQNEKDFQEAEDRLLKSGGLNNDSFMDRLLTRFISRQITGVFLKTSFTPNQITLLSLFVGLGAALCFYKGGYEMGIMGSFLLLVSAWIDCADGEIARLKFLVSEWGAKLDIIADNIVHCFVFFSIGMGLFHSTGESIFKYLGLLSVWGGLMSFVFLIQSILGKKAEATKTTTQVSGKKDVSDHLANRDFTYFLFVLAILGRLDVFIFLSAIGSNIFAIYLAWKKFQVSS